MSKIHLWLVIVGLLAIVVVVYYIILNRPGTNSSANEETQILLYVRSGDVSYKTEEMESFERATTSPIIISNRSYVHTGVGMATILFPDNSSVDLDKYTELEVNYKDKNISLYQTLGSTYHRIQTLLSGSTYEVRTPGTLAAVRGTKFAVNYDKNTKTTKVAVTESIVQVSKQTESGVSTEIVLLEEGKTAKIDERQKATSTESRGILIIETVRDAEMKEWTEKNQQLDVQLDSIKEERGRSGDVVRELIKTSLLKESTPEKPISEGIEKEVSVPRVEEKNVEPEKKKEEVPKTQQLIEEAKPEIRQETNIPARPVVKIDEEIFFDKFSDLFIRHFYVEDTGGACSLSLTPEQRVSAVSSYASESGYPFSSDTLLSFARAIDTYCKDKSADVKTKLQGRFDTEFPFNESI